MSESHTIEVKKDANSEDGSVPIENPEKTNSPEEGAKEQELKHAEAVAFVEGHKDFFDTYAGGRIKVAPAPKSIKTFAFDLETNTIYINSMFYGPLGLSEQKTIFATCHEVEHLLEKLQMLSEEGGTKKFEKYLERVKASKAFSIMDNCVADIRENKSVCSRVSGMDELEKQIYKEHLFASLDFTSDPRHLQFSQVLLREARVPEEKCVVDDEVRKMLDEVVNIPNLMEIMTDPSTPMSLRLKLQDKYLLPKMKALLEKDIEEYKKKKQEEKEKREKGEPKDGGESGEGGGKGEDDKNQKNKTKGGEGEPKGGKGDTPKGKEVGDKGGGESDKGELETDPNKIFANDYARIKKKFPEALPIGDIEKVLKQWKEKRGVDNAGDKADGEYAKKIGVEKSDLQRYRTLVKNLNETVNPETRVGIIEELRNLFSRIISKRLKVIHAPRYPVEEGEELVDVGQLVTEVKAGNLTPKVWQDIEIREKKGDKFGEVEITLVCDRSSSMNDGDGSKAEQQRKSAVLVMEVLKDFAEMCRENEINMEKSLKISSEIYGFGAGEDSTPMKKMSPELGEAERVKVLKQLYHLRGSTTDFNSLEAIHAGIDGGQRKRMKEGELKKIVIVFTDGDSDKPAEVQNKLNKLKEDGVVVIGIGMTKNGRSVLTTYAPNALVVEDISRLPLVVGELLKEHLRDL